VYPPMSAMMRTPRWIAMNWDFSCLAAVDCDRVVLGLDLHLEDDAKSPLPQGKSAISSSTR
jgi:hypothetical protein